MSQVVRAVYENGVLRPLGSLELQEHQQIRVTVEPVSSGVGEPVVQGSDDPLAQVCVSTGIADLAEKFDDYRFGRRRPCPQSFSTRTSGVPDPAETVASHLGP
jgi:predicted DNA-binding antitoxin AbrB/MazE fold protein